MTPRAWHNRDVTKRVWLTGYYIVEYEQHGSDRAKYGEGLIKKLAARLDNSSLGVTYLKNAKDEFGKSHSPSDLSGLSRADDISVSPEVLFSRLTLKHLVRLTSIKGYLQRNYS